MTRGSVAAPRASRAAAPLAVAVAVVALAFVSPARGPQVVSVRVGDDVATGFVAGDGRVVTVAHVLGYDVRVDGRPARVLRRDDRLDLAVLAVDVSGPQVRLGGDDPRVVRRADAALDGSGWKRPVLELRGDVAGGDSGAPVVTADGRVAGVVFARSRAHTRRAWAIDASDRAVVDFVRLSGTNSTRRTPR